MKTSKEMLRDLRKTHCGLEADQARLLAVAVAAKNAAVRLELIQKAGPLGQSPKWTQDLLDALAAVEDLL